MEFKHEKNRIFYQDENGKLLAEVTFPEVNENIVEINHTFVDSSLRGQGIASKLVQMVCDYANENNLKIKPSCSYAVKWFEKNSKYQNLLEK